EAGPSRCKRFIDRESVFKRSRGSCGCIGARSGCCSGPRLARSARYRREDHLELIVILNTCPGGGLRGATTLRSYTEKFDPGATAGQNPRSGISSLDGGRLYMTG